MYLCLVELSGVRAAHLSRQKHRINKKGVSHILHFGVPDIPRLQSRRLLKNTIAGFCVSASTSERHSFLAQRRGRRAFRARIIRPLLPFTGSNHLPKTSNSNSSKAQAHTRPYAQLTPVAVSTPASPGHHHYHYNSTRYLARPLTLRHQQGTAPHPCQQPSQPASRSSQIKQQGPVSQTTSPLAHQSWFTIFFTTAAGPYTTGKSPSDLSPTPSGHCETSARLREWFLAIPQRPVGLL